MKRTSLTLSLLLIFAGGCSKVIDPPKYESGDCITPIDPAYSWYGQYARVEALGKIPDYEGETYTLEFPNYNSADKHFARYIEFDTKAVDLENCLPVKSSNQR